MGSNPSSNKAGNDYPVENVSWDDCQEFIRKLNARTGLNFRLSTEAEWEYAARGGRKSSGYKYSGSNSIGNVAWYDVNSGNKTYPVGRKSPNELGLYDMSGNVWEWCQDWYGKYSSEAQTNPVEPASGGDRVLRGGSYWLNAGYCRVSLRDFKTLATGSATSASALFCPFSFSAGYPVLAAKFPLGRPERAAQRNGSGARRLAPACHRT